jgi:hypothetical protein
MSPSAKPKRYSVYIAEPTAGGWNATFGDFATRKLATVAAATVSGTLQPQVVVNPNT